MRAWRRIRKVLLAIMAAALFVTALKLMQAGARAVAPLIEQHLDIETPVGALGFGWLAAYLLLSGSPVAITAVTFFEGGQIDEVAAFAMITGSRLGAAFLVLLLGFFYVFYHREPVRDLRMGLLALIVTASIYLPAFAVGYGLLEWGFSGASLDDEASAIGEALAGGPAEEIADRAGDLFPPWSVFLLGLALLIVSFRLFDLSLPKMDAESGRASGVRRYLYRRWPMFALGAGITLVSMSVSVSLGLLVPLHDRRIVRPKHVVPYIMGANITTFIDTLLAAMTMQRGGAMTVVLVEIGAVTVISLLMLVFAFDRYERTMLAAVDLVTSSRRNLAVFVAVLLATPVALMLLPWIAA